MKTIFSILAVAIAAAAIGLFVYSSLHATMQAIHTALSVEVTK